MCVAVNEVELLELQMVNLGMTKKPGFRSVGTVKYVELANFMCHTFLKVPFCSNVIGHLG